ncbi:MAG: hypothetical protein HC933_01535 [Pleurocapsa sp. SU_196_0]|nr:hypothetical protein [Pleurocapsa sp. SU_196_0]
MKSLMGLGMVRQSPARRTRLLRWGVAVAERIGNSHLLARVWNDLGVALYAQNPREAFSAWQVAARFAENAGDIALLMRLEINTALVSMQDLEFDEAERLLNHALELAERIGERNLAKSTHLNLALCRYARNDASGSRRHFAEVTDHPSAAYARLWETRLMLEQGDGFVTTLPESDDPDLKRLLEAQLALSFGDYELAYELTERPNPASDWHWALARVHAGWRLKRDFQMALAQLLNLESLQDPVLTPELARQYTRFIMLAVTTPAWDEAVRQRLERSLESLSASPIGQLTRDIAFSLEQSKPV